MLSFKQFIDEELTASQKKFADEVTPKTNERLDFSNRVFGDQSRISVPLEHHEGPAVPHPEIASHLAAHGIGILDYTQGTAQEIGGHNRPVRIGKSLVRTGASRRLVDIYASERSRQSKNISGQKIIISRHPNDVAAMSTGRGWKSCMSLPDSMDSTTVDYDHDVKHDIHQATHVAYLVNKHDNNIENPLARIALKRYSTGLPDGSVHDILHPEPVTYGTGNDSFAHTVRKWTQTHFALHEGKVYRRPGSVYSDHHNPKIINTSPTSLDKLVTHDDPDIKTIVAREGGDRHHARLMTDGNAYVQVATARHGSSAIQHKMIDNELAKIPSKQHQRVLANVAMYGDHTHHDRLLTSDHPWVREMVATHGNDEHRDKLLTDSDPVVRKAIIAHGNSDHHTYLAHHDPDSNVRALAKFRLRNKDINDPPT